MNKSVLISGYGSIGRRHAHILSRLVKKKNLTILTNQKLTNFQTIKNIKALNKVNPHYIVISNAQVPAYQGKIRCRSSFYCQPQIERRNQEKWCL